MKTIANRLRWARQEAGFMSAAEAARAMAMEDGTYRHHENGTREAAPQQLAGYARKFKVNVEWLLTGRGRIKVEADVSPTSAPIQYAPIIAWVQAGNLSEVIEMLDEFTEFVPVAHHRSTVVALEVHGTSMNRIAPPGAKIVVDYEDTDPVDHQRYIVRLDNGITFKRYRCTDGPIRLEPESSEPHEIIFPKDGQTFEIIGRVIFSNNPL